MDRMSWAAAAVVLGMMTSVSAAAEPRVLADSELDAITAAGVLVDVSSFAVAFGDLGRTRTDADTFVFGGKAFDLGLGRSVGLAFACCREEAGVAVGSAAAGSGDIVHGTMHTVVHDGRFMNVGLSVAFVLAFSIDRQFASARGGHLALLEQLRAAVADFHLDRSDAVMVGAQ